MFTSAEARRQLHPHQPARARRLLSGLAWLLAACVVAAIVRLAWLSDDCFITLRTVENWVTGHGPVWNVAERTQTYTHPLWMLLLACGRLLTGEVYYTTLALSLTAAVVTLWLLRRLAAGAATYCAILTLLLGTRAVLEYSTSGLENPLSFALLAATACVGLHCTAPGKRLFASALLGALMVCTRLDLALFAVPVVAAAARSVPFRVAARAVAAGLSPLLAWLLFATVYYGSPLPTTAHAKAFSGVPAPELWAQGVHYLQHAWRTDPVLLLVIGLGAATGLAARSCRCRALAIGTVAYVLYVVHIGGDFMRGRMLTPPCMAALSILAIAAGRTPLVRTVPFACVGAAMFAWSFTAGLQPWMRPPSADEIDMTNDRGIVDERRFYYERLGLASAQRDIPQSNAGTMKAREFGEQRTLFVVHAAVGVFGYEAGTGFHIVDPWLCDPLLMRLPVADLRRWRIGHFSRRLPEGYLETLALGGQRLHHAGLQRYYDLLRRSITGPVWSLDRARAMWQLATGAADADLAAFVETEYRQPPRLSLPAEALAEPVPEGTQWFHSERAHVVYAGGLEVLWPQPNDCRRVRLLLGGEVLYCLTFCRGDQVLAGIRVPATTNPFLGAREWTVDVPPAAQGFDRLRIDEAAPQMIMVAFVAGIVLLP